MEISCCGALISLKRINYRIFYGICTLVPFYDFFSNTRIALFMRGREYMLIFVQLKNTSYFIQFNLCTFASIQQIALLAKNSMVG